MEPSSPREASGLRRELAESVTVQEAADRALRVSESTVRRLLAAGAFPGAFRVGRSIRIPRSDLNEYRKKHLLSNSQH